MPGVEPAAAANRPPAHAAPAAQADVALPVTLTLAEARQTAAALEAALAAAGTRQMLVIDCADLRTLDSAALSVLLQAQRAARARGRHLRLQAPPPKLQALARLYGVHDLLGLGAQA